MALIDVDLQSLAGLAMIDELDRDLLASDLPGPRMRLMNGVYKAQGREVGSIVQPTPQPGDQAIVEPFDAVRELTSGTTIVLNNIAPRLEGRIRQLSHDLSRVTSTRAQVNAYVSEREASGFGLHWDDHDVLIVQCRGRKHWEVFAPTALSPVLGYVDQRSAGESLFSIVLEPGMGLFIPRGWGHRVAGFADELSVHLTCGMRRMSGLDLLRGLIEEDLGATGIAVDTDGRLLVEPFRGLDLSDAAIESAFARWRSRSKPLQKSGTLSVWSAIRRGFEDWQVTAPSLGAPVFVESSDLDREREVGLSACGADFALSRRWVAPFEALLEGQALSAKEIREMVPGAEMDECVSWVTELGRRSVIVLEPADA